MARMYPQNLPGSVESKAEEILYQELQAQLPDGYTVLYSVKWLMRDRKRHDNDGEIDFLIIHPDLGVLVLEVKGGRIRVEGPSGHWYTIDKHDQEHLIKNPFDQATKNLHALRDKLDEAPATQPYSYRMQHAVAFPNVILGQTNIGLYGDRELIIDSTDMPRLEMAIRRIMGTPNKQPVLSSLALRAFVNTLQPTMEISRIGIGTHVLESERQIAILTENQFRILDYLALHPQALISGCAGSGKTMLAMEKARRLANEGFTVLFTCFNRNLAQWVRSRFQSDPNTISERIYVNHYHGLVIEFCKKSGIALQQEIEALDPQALSEYLNDTLPEKMHEANTKLRLRFDAIVADEGQDFAEMWWVTLLDLLKDREQGVFYIFYDPNQRIYGRDLSLPFTDAPFTLNTNCRNTATIHNEVQRFYQGTPQPLSGGPAGIKPAIIPILQTGEREALRKAFTHLFTEEKVPPRNVVVLTPRGLRTSEFKEGTTVGTYTLTWGEAGPGQVPIRSIYSYKGLESPVVILAELDKIESQQQDYLMYVALSRPRNHLIVLGRLPQPLAEPVTIRPGDRYAYGEL
ncbi:MAG TPA: NERD domain-containing protein [Chloroflexia bacterium]|nr:NERD domain-containing protein [Chloroflexia bacterium]